MRSVIAFCVFFLAAVALARPGDDHYSDRYDNINLNEILSNKKLFNGYFNCVMDKGKCTPDGKQLKDHIKEAMENDCAKCTEVQKNNTNRIIKHMINNEEAFWNELTSKYDPERKYAPKYEKEFRGTK